MGICTLTAAIAVVSNIIVDSSVLVPVILAIVGLHFLPLTAIFKVKPYYVTRLLWLLIIAGTFLILPISSTIGQVSF